MNNISVSRQITRPFTLLLCCVVCCMGCVSGLSFCTLRSMLNIQKAHSQSFVPAKRLTASFERESLNARIFFIYFVTIQKPGSLDNGWKRYHNAEARVRDLEALVNAHDELRTLRVPVEKLKADVAAYSVALSATLSMVQGGELKGTHYDAQVKEWAARGAVMVTDAGNLEIQCFNASEADSGSIGNKLKKSETYAIVGFSIGSLICALLTLFLVRSLCRKLVASETNELIASAL